MKNKVLAECLNKRNHAWFCLEWYRYGEYALDNYELRRAAQRMATKALVALENLGFEPWVVN